MCWAGPAPGSAWPSALSGRPASTPAALASGKAIWDGVEVGTEQNWAGGGEDWAQEGGGEGSS